MLNFVFDLYGTLADIRTDEQSEDFAAAFSDYFDGLCGCRTDFFEECGKICRTFTGNMEPDIIAVFRGVAEKRGAVLSDGQLSAAARRFRRLSLKKLALYPEVPPLLKELGSRGCGVYLLSNAQAAFTLDEIEELGIGGYFDGIELSSDFGEKKPSLSFFEHLLGKYGICAEQCVYTGNDFFCDIAPAKALGMRAAYIKTDTSPAGDRLEEVAKAADFCTVSHAELSRYLLSLSAERSDHEKS